MTFDPRTLSRAAFLLSAGAAVAVLFSIAVSQIFLTAALLVALAAREHLRLPAIKLPLAVFLAGTVIAVLASGDPRAGLPQIKKFFVFLILVLLYSTLRRVKDVRSIALAWAAVATASGLWAIVQFWHKRSDAIRHGLDFYNHYVGERATGFMSHWMTFSAEQMMAVLLLASMLLFGAVHKRRSLLWACAAVIGASLAVAWTRSVWLGTASGALYLVSVSRPKLLLAVPAAAVVLWFVAPGALRQRIVSVYQPHGDTDSNEHRRVTQRTGIAMIHAHPWLGLGPEIVGRDFMKYVPSDIPRPLPTGFYGHLHNVYLQYAAERGVFTLGAFVWLVGKIVFDFGRAVCQLAPAERLRRAVLHGCLAAILAVLVEALFELNLGDTEVLTMFLSVIAFGYIAAENRGEAVNG